MRRPADFQTSLYGFFAASLMASVQYVVDGIYAAIDRQNWWPINWLKDDVEQVLDDALQWIIGGIFPGAPGSIDYFTSGPEALVYMSGAIYDTLSFFHMQRQYIQYTLIPSQIYQVENLVWSLYYGSEDYSRSLYYQALNALYSGINSVYSYIGSEVNYLTNVIDSGFSTVYAYVHNVQSSLLDTIARDVATLNLTISQLRQSLTSFITQVRDDAAHNLAVAKVEAAAALAAAVTWITAVVIPGAFAAYTVEMTALIAAGMDVLWPVAASSIDSTALQLATTLPLVSARALDVPPEALPGIGGMAEALAAEAAFVTAVQSNACAPLWTKMHEFADDTAELDGLVSTVLLTGMVAAMVSAPVDTAAAIADTVAGPLNDAAQAVLSLIGLS